jgi:Acetyl co-enzyme A carboxylase carboxyltransferase alpha subunit
MNLLDFEKPIAELESKLEDMKTLAGDSDKEVQAAVKALEKKILDLKKETFDNLTGWQRVQLSRHPDRPYTLDYIYEITTDFIELHGDRNVADDKAMVGGLGTIDGQTFMIIGQQKGRNTKQRQMRNFGMANPEGYRKALRLMKMAEKFNKPIITFIDTPGAFPGLEAEERGQGEAIARNLKEMFMLKVPVICIVIGLGRQRDDGQQLRMLCVRHALGLGRRRMRVNAIAARVGDRDRDVDHLLGQGVQQRVSGHDRLDIRPGRFKQRRIERKRSPHVVDVLGLASGAYVGEDGLDARIRRGALRKCNGCHWAVP